MPAPFFWMFAATLATVPPLPSSFAATCSTCHSAPRAEAVPVLSRDADTLRMQLRGLRDGQIPGTTMPRLLQGLTDAELDALVSELTTTGSKAQ